METKSRADKKGGYDLAAPEARSQSEGGKRHFQQESPRVRPSALILDSVNYLHPFREGNGRTQREFLRLLALEKDWKLNLNPPDNVSVYERYMEGTISGDIDLLNELIFECLSRE